MDRVQRIQQLEAEIQALKADMELENSIYWQPEEGDRYYWLDSCGIVWDAIWEGHAYDTDRYELGNAFPTKQMAEDEYERRKILTTLRRAAKGHVGAYGTNNNFVIHLTDWTQDEIDVSTDHIPVAGGIYFKTADDAWDAINKIGVEQVKKVIG